MAIAKERVHVEQPATSNHLILFPARSILETEGVHVSYGTKPAIQNISLTFPHQAITALIGPSGCGKSTFLRSLNRMNDEINHCQVKGKIAYRGIDIYDPQVNVFELRKQIGMVFQKPTPFVKSIYDNIAFGPARHGVKKKRLLDEIVETSLRKAALWDEVKDKLHSSALSLSGGQQQRLCIARAIAMKPQVLLLDEPASALDPISTRKIEELLNDLKKEYTMIIVTHNMQQAARISDFTAFFLMGEMVEYGPTQQLFSQPKDERTKGYVTGNFG
ncbi:phosphate ABC transporter ATP-binding protein PstB [Lederbergia sp. NSJ-179]|uniref:phosphate ABC transporter ATP-binding protein PstB n=1 Tax=Lederbergia sp. NSJ-179 TaxID=2931402 RepID=UPI001FD20611|nr:phosphate ABC transporter ATP-binding protein PstB [Lederbergia sp. NSJ-179]MCJ7840204.1 phosphate ABC transporter ATP-binding protein PstB [Lederbergia sp. NSJ-179]